MTKQFFDWDAATVSQLRALHAEGLSFTLIADAIGRGVTGTALRKKASRLGLKRERAVSTKPMGPKRQAKPPKPIEPEAVGPVEDIVDGCKFIAGDPKLPGWRMCGQPGVPWCEFHAAKVYEPKRSAV